MRIQDAKVIVCSAGGNFVSLKLVTEDGVHGLGDATLNGRELAVASYLKDHLVPTLIGCDARRIEDIWQMPGLGVEINEELAAQYPYRRAYLPLNRREDGTMHDW